MKKRHILRSLFSLLLIPAFTTSSMVAANESANVVDQRTNTATIETLEDDIADLQECIKKRAIYYNTVAEMKADNSLTAGMAAVTLGYYSANDGGGGTYIIRENANDTIDNGTIIQLNSGLIAELVIVNHTVNLMQFGCIIDDITADNADCLNKAIQYVSNKGGTIKLPIGKIYFQTPIQLVNATNITIIGSGNYGARDTRIYYTGAGYLFNVYGAGILNIENAVFRGNNANGMIGFFDNAPNTANCRIDKVTIKKVQITYAMVGIKIDCPAGYIYIDRCDIERIPIGGVGIEIGKDYANTVSVLPGYIYITHTNINDVTNKQGFAGIAIYTGQWMFISENDICNFRVGHGIYLSSDNNTIDEINISNNSLFKNFYGIRCERTNKLMRNIKSTNNNIHIYENGYGEVYNSVNTNYIFGVVISNETYTTQFSSIAKLVKLNRVYNYYFTNCTPIYGVTEPLYQYIDITGCTGYQQRDGMFQNQRANKIIPANGSTTITLGGLYSWLKNDTPVIVNLEPQKGNVTYTISFDANTCVTTITFTNNNNEDIKVAAFLN